MKKKFRSVAVLSSILVLGGLVTTSTLVSCDPARGQHAITVTESSGATCTPDKTSASTGETVTLTFVLDSGMSLQSVTVTDASGNEVSTTRGVGNVYTFVMPDSSVTVSYLAVSTQEYNITLDYETSDAIVTSSDATAHSGETITITVRLSSGKYLSGVNVTGTSGDSVDVTKASDTQYTFVMPNEAVTVSILTGAYEYSVTLGTVEGATITASVDGLPDVSAVTYGTEVNVSVVLDEAHKATHYISSISILANNNAVDYEVNGYGNYTFSMPANNVTISATLAQRSENMNIGTFVERLAAEDATYTVRVIGEGTSLDEEDPTVTTTEVKEFTPNNYSILKYIGDTGYVMAGGWHNVTVDSQARTASYTLTEMQFDNETGYISDGTPNYGYLHKEATSYKELVYSYGLLNSSVVEQIKSSYGSQIYMNFDDFGDGNTPAFSFASLSTLVLDANPNYTYFTDWYAQLVTEDVMSLRFTMAYIEEDSQGNQTAAAEIEYTAEIELGVATVSKDIEVDFEALTPQEAPSQGTGNINSIQTVVGLENYALSYDYQGQNIFSYFVKDKYTAIEVNGALSDLIYYDEATGSLLEYYLTEEGTYTTVTNLTADQVDTYTTQGRYASELDFVNDYLKELVGSVFGGFPTLDSFNGIALYPYMAEDLQFGNSATGEQFTVTCFDDFLDIYGFNREIDTMLGITLQYSSNYYLSGYSFEYNDSGTSDVYTDDVISLGALLYTPSGQGLGMTMLSYIIEYTNFGGTCASADSYLASLASSAE